MGEFPPNNQSRRLRRRYGPLHAPNDWEAEIECRPSPAQLDHLLAVLGFELDDGEYDVSDDDDVPSYLSSLWPAWTVRLGVYDDGCQIAVVWPHDDRPGFDEAVARLTHELDASGCEFSVTRCD